MATTSKPGDGTDPPSPGEIINDMIECWHSGAGAGKQLHEYLGLTWDDYAAWARRAATDKATLDRMVTGLRAEAAAEKGGSS